MDLYTLGFDDFFRSHFVPYHEQGFIPARVALEHRERYQLFCERGELSAQLSGRFRHQASSLADYPTVGDWVAVEPDGREPIGVIHAMLTRRSSFSRKAVLAGGPKYRPGRTDEQVLAANIDTVMLVAGLDVEFNIRRVERYVTVAWDSGAQPAIILNKADLRDNPEAIKQEVEDIAVGLPVHLVSAQTGAGLDQLQPYMSEGATIAFLGSSGVGKSTLINSILGDERQGTGEVRKRDGRGRHTTTQRELIVLPNGSVVIDTPGLREIQPWQDEGSLAKAFSDVEELFSQCRFGDCSHASEPGCAIQAALEDGRLDPERYESYLKLQKEMAHLARRRNVHSRRQQERQWHKRVRQHHLAMKDLRKKGLA